MPRDAVSRTANVDCTVRHKWVNGTTGFLEKMRFLIILVKKLSYKLTLPFAVSPKWSLSRQDELEWNWTQMDLASFIQCSLSLNPI